MGQSLTRRAVLADEVATLRLGSELVRALPASPAGWLILLQGDLGAGKSTLARAMLREFGHSGAVPSPTYTLVEPYDFAFGSVYHIDLYRISSSSELEYLGWDDLGDGMRIVEWPERVPGIEAVADLHIRLSYDGEGRAVELQALSLRAVEVLQGMDLK